MVKFRSVLKTLAVISGALLFSAANAQEIKGAGSTAAAPLYNRWQKDYAHKTGLTLSYDAIGSSAGIQKIKESQVTFGASDVPLPAKELESFNLIQFPTVVSGIVPFVNLPGIKPGTLRLTADVLVGIYTGTIVRWDDPALAIENPTLNLPRQDIVVLARKDGSGTTYNLSAYLSHVNPEWESRFGTSFAIDWAPHVKTIKGSSGLVSAVKRTPYSIGYAEYTYVQENSLNYVLLKNRDGAYVKPEATSFSAALRNSDWGSSGQFEHLLIDLPGPASWPVTSGTFILVPRVSHTPEQTSATLTFFAWAMIKGDAAAAELGCVRLPDRVQARVYRELTSVRDIHGSRLPVSVDFH